jgi:hypothetical protein
MDPLQNQPVETKRSLGPIVGIIVIVILLVIGAFYVWGGKMAPKASDDISSIEADLSETDTEIDLSGLDTIE